MPCIAGLHTSCTSGQQARRACAMLTAGACSCACEQDLQVCTALGINTGSKECQMICISFFCMLLPSCEPLPSHKSMTKSLLHCEYDSMIVPSCQTRRPSPRVVIAAAYYIECVRCIQIVMDWLGKLLGLPQQFLSKTPEGSLAPGGGVIQGTASEAALVCMLAARARALEGRPIEDMAQLVAYTSDQVQERHRKSSRHAQQSCCSTASQSLGCGSCLADSFQATAGQVWVHDLQWRLQSM